MEQNFGLSLTDSRCCKKLQFRQVRLLYRPHERVDTVPTGQCPIWTGHVSSPLQSHFIGWMHVTVRVFELFRKKYCRKQKPAFQITAGAIWKAGFFDEINLLLYLKISDKESMHL